MRFPKLSLRSGREPDFTNRERTTAAPKLILHAGTPKTGTTSIQFALSENRDHLRSLGVFYPRIDAFFPVDPKLLSARAHFAFATAVANFTPRDRKRLARFVDALHKQSADVDRVILSAESMYRRTARPSRGSGRETKAQRRVRYLERLATVTSGFDTEVLLYLRRVDRFAASLYAESIAKTDNAWSFQEFLQARAQRFSYRRQIDLFKTQFPVQVRNFDTAAQSGLIAAFCADAGIPEGLPAVAERRRPSIPNAAVLWLCRAKRERQNMGDRERNHRWHFALLPQNAELFEQPHRTGFWTDLAERDAFVEKHQADVSEVSFAPLETEIEPLVQWSDRQHREAERQFHAWQKANAAMLRTRSRKKIPPFVLDP